MLATTHAHAKAPSSFFGQTMAYFSLAIGSATAAIFGALWFLPPALVFSSGFMLFSFAATLALVWTAHSWSEHRFGFVLLIVLAALLGVSLVPLIAIAASTAPLILAKALLSTVGLYAGLALYGITTQRDLSGIGGFLMAGLIGMLAVSLITLVLHLFGISVWSNGIEMVFSGFGILLFAGFTAYDWQKIKELGGVVSPIQAAINLFLDFIMLFQYVLRFMLAFGSRD